MPTTRATSPATFASWATRPWGYLRHRSFLDTRDVVEIQRLVTMGSPVGNAELRELLFSNTAAMSLPRGVRSWINAVNADDPFASRLTATDTTSRQAGALRGIDDVMTGSADEPAHDLRGYLRDVSTARAIIGAWCDAPRVLTAANICRRKRTSLQLTPAVLYR